jgi:hypothetical protein
MASRRSARPQRTESNVPLRYTFEQDIQRKAGGRLLPTGEAPSARAANNPTSSTLNFPLGDDRANAVTVQLGSGSTLSISFVAPSNGPSPYAIFDVTGYFKS